MRFPHLLLFILLLSLAACTSAAPAPAVTVPAVTAPVPAVSTQPPAPAQTLPPASPTVLSSSAAAPQAAEPTSAPATTAAASTALPPASPAALPQAPASTTAPAGASASAARPAPFSIGVPAGDAYAPFSVAVDAGKNLAYVYHADSVERRPVISVVDLSAGKVTRLLRLNMTTPGASGRLLLTPDGNRLFLQENQGYSLLTIDVATGAVRKLLDGVQEADMSDDGRMLYVLQGRGPAAFSAADLLAGKTEPIWRTAGPFARLAFNDRQLLAASFDSPATLNTFDAETGKVQATGQAPGTAHSVAAGPDGGWAVAVGGEKARLIRYAANLNSLGETPIPYSSGVTYDAARNRYLIGGSRYTENEPAGHRVILSIDAGDGKVLAEQPWLGVGAPTAFAPWGENSLVGYPQGEAAMLSILDAPSLAARAQIPTGVRVENVALDEAGQRLFVADDLGRTHVLSLPDGRELAVWEGSWPLAFDGANGRLYVNRGAGVAALDAQTGDLLVQFPQRGDPAPDPNADLVYIANRGVTTYDRSGKKLGTLASTFPAPHAFSGNPYGIAVEVNPVTGHVAVVMDNGIPGSNGGSYLRVYERQSDKYLEPKAPHSFVMDVATDQAGQWYVAYSPTRAEDALQLLTPNGQQLRQLDHRSGHIALDEGKDELFLVTDGRVTRVKASTLDANAVYQGPEYAAQMAYSPGNRTAYVVQSTGPLVTPVNVDGLLALDLRPVPGRPAPDAYSDNIAVVANGRQRLVVTRLQDTYRSTDGASWDRLLPSLELSLGYVTLAAPRTVFVAGRSPAGGEGVWRSTDAGDTWEFLAAGLTDLAPASPVLANSADEAYFVNDSQGLLSWDAGQKQWQAVNSNFAPGTWGGLSLAPDGTLFRSTNYLERSADRGATWEQLGETTKAGSIIGYSALYTTTHGIFSVVRTGYRIEGLQRSTDGGRTWQPSITGAPFGFDGYQPEMASGFGKTYLLLRPYQGNPVLLGTNDFGDTWQQASVEAAAGIDHIAVDPLDGRLWTGIQGGVRAIDPEKLAWSVIGGKATPTPVPTGPARPSKAIATAAPCPKVLSGSDAEINARNLGIGCPSDIDRSIPMARQRFQNGQMIWRGDRRQIYVLYKDGRWQGYEDLWLDGQPPDDPTIVPPSGLQQPARGFGKVWREKLGGPKAALGWALDKEQGVQGQAQAWDRGTVLRFGGEAIVLLDSGQWR